MPTPITAPMMEWEVDTGIPMVVAKLNQSEEPTRAIAIPNISTVGSSAKASVERIFFLIVSETLLPTSTAPRNSQMAANIMACQYFKDLDETEEENELATSLAPMLKASKKAKIIAMAKI